MGASQTSSSLEKLVILGTGPAGLTAAIYAARAELKPLVVEGIEPGGQLMLTSDVENYPGFPNGVLGPEMMEIFKKQAARFGTRFVKGDIKAVNTKKKPIELTAADGKVIQTQTLIIATGASAKWLGIHSETRLRGKGVSACATCDGFFFKNQVVAVVGGGDTAMEESMFLTRFASQVIVIHRRDQFRASKIMQERVRSHPKIRLVMDSTVEEVLGEKTVEGIRVKNIKSVKTETLAVQGLFIAIGHEPNTSLFRDQLKCDVKGYLQVEPGSTRTTMPGVFAAGDVADPIYRQAVTAAGTGCMAALDAERFLDGHGG